MKKLFCLLLVLCSVCLVGCFTDGGTEDTDVPGMNTDSASQPHLTHVWDEGKVTVEPTCQRKGKKTFTCDCGEKYTQELPVKAHEYVNDVCTVCKEQRASEGLELTLIGNNYYMVKSLGTCQDSKVVIPNTYQGLPVRSLERDVFHNKTNVTEVVIPENVESLPSSMFYGCGKLKALTLPFVGVNVEPNPAARLNILGVLFGTSNYSGAVRVQQSCGELVDYYIPASLEYVKVTGGALGTGVFSGCTSLKKVEVLVSSIADKAFYGCSGLKELTLQSAGLVVGDYAFYRCGGLTKVEIPYGVQTLGEGTFEECTGLQEVVLPTSITIIKRYAFTNCTALKSVVIPNTRGWYYTSSETSTRGTDISSNVISSPQTVATWLSDTYDNFCWKRF